MNNKDWTGNKNSVFKTLGASNHCLEERQSEDYYATEPKAVEMLLEIEDIDINKPIWECASGENHISNIFRDKGYKVRTSDIVKRTETTEQLDFLSQNEMWDGNIITNPPYSKALEFVEKAMETITNGNNVIMFLKLQFLEGKKRKTLFKKYPPKTIWISSSRLKCAKNGEFDKMEGSSVAYAWYIWEKGYKGDTIVKWFN